jgi:hypothetical protein
LHNVDIGVDISKGLLIKWVYFFVVGRGPASTGGKGGGRWPAVSVAALAESMATSSGFGGHSFSTELGRPKSVTARGGRGRLCYRRCRRKELPGEILAAVSGLGGTPEDPSESSFLKARYVRVTSIKALHN